MKNYEWYQSLIKPSFAPPSWIFGPVWSFLYLIIFSSFGYTIKLVLDRKIPRIILVPLAVNLLFNFLFTPLQFGLKSNILAAIDILIVLGTIIWFMKIVFPYSKVIFTAQIPYLLWVAFATVLQLTITCLNR
jgi:tryptophan-rich sensory protein